MKIAQIFSVRPPDVWECEYCTCITTKVEYYKETHLLYKLKNLNNLYF